MAIQISNEPINIEEESIELPTNKPKKARGTNLANTALQGVAGITDVATSFPALASLIGSGAETLYDTATNDKSIGDNFVINQGEDTYKNLNNLTAKMRGGVNDFLGIDEPILAEDQIARLITSSFIPAVGPLSKVAQGASALAKLGRVATPLMKVTRSPTGSVLNKGNALRFGTQVGLGAGIDQGIRAAIDKPGLPTILDDEALYGPEGLEATTVSGKQTDTNLEGVSGSDDLSSTISISNTPIKLATMPSTPEEGRGILQQLDADIAREEYKDTALVFASAFAAAAGSYAGIKTLSKRAQARVNKLSPYGNVPSKYNRIEQFAVDADAAINPYNDSKRLTQLPGIMKTAASDSFKFVGESMVDKSKSIANKLADMGHRRSTIDHVVTNSHNDYVGVARQLWDDGKFGQGSGITTHSGRSLELEFLSMSPADQKAAQDVALSQTNIQSGTTGGLWRNGRTNEQLSSEVDKMFTPIMVDGKMTDSAPAAWLRKMGETYDAHLDYQVFRKTITQKQADVLRSKFTDPTHGNLAYMPLHEVTPRGLFKRIQGALGWHPNKSKELDIMAEHHARGPDGVDHPLNPIQALEQYTLHSIDHTNTQAFHAQALGELSGVRLRPSIDGAPSHTRFFLDKDGVHRDLKPGQTLNKTSGVTYLGKGGVDGVVENTRIINVADDDYAKKLFGTGNKTVADLKAKLGDREIVAVQQHGELHLFHVQDKGVRAALDLKPELSTTLQLMSHYKNVFTQFTTGAYSPFAPVSNMFSTQQIALATSGQEGIMAGLKSVSNSLKGTGDLIKNNVAKELADYFSHRIAQNTALGRQSSSFVLNQSKRFEDIFKRAMNNDVRREAGRMSAPLSGNPASTSLTDMADTFGERFSGAYPDGMHTVLKLWKGINNALQEGPAWGAIQAKIGQARMANKGVPLTPRQIREASDYGKLVGGDVQRVGGSKFATAFQASVPFSGAMIQSWNSLGSAAIANFGKFAGGLGALIGVPTVVEMASTAMLSEAGETFQDPTDPNKQWTYNDYYWNGYTTQQRTDNIIMMVPGKPPWEAAIFPISPEFGLFRGVVMESIDAMFNLSDVGNIKTADNNSGKIGRNHALGALVRVLDVPVPPLVGAAFAASGVDIRIGGGIEKIADAENPGVSFDIVRGRPLGQGERVTGKGITKYVGQDLDTNTVAVLGEIFGAGASLYVGMHEAFMAGKNLKTDDGGVLKGIGSGAEALMNGLNRSARWTQPIFGKTLRPNANDEIASELFMRKDNLKRLSADFVGYMNRDLANRAGKPNVGNAQVTSDDPINLELSADAGNLQSQLKMLDGDVSNLRRQMSIVGNSSTIDGKSVSIKERNDYMDMLSVQISTLKSQQLADLIDYEEKASKILSERYNRRIDVDLSTFSPRGNLPAGDSIFKRINPID